MPYARLSVMPEPLPRKRSGLGARCALEFARLSLSTFALGDRVCFVSDYVLDTFETSGVDCIRKCRIRMRQTEQRQLFSMRIEVGFRAANCMDCASGASSAIVRYS